MSEKSTLTLHQEWEACSLNPSRSVGALLKKMTPHALALLEGFKTTQKTLKTTFPALIIAYEAPLFKMGVYDASKKCWHTFLISFEQGTPEVRYGEKHDGKRFPAVAGNLGTIPSDFLNTLGMDYVTSDKEDFRCDTHWSTIAAVMGVRDLTQRNVKLRPSWEILCMGFYPIRLVEQDLPDRFLQHICDAKEHVFVVDAMSAETDFTCRMVVYYKQDYWRAQSLERIEKYFA